jgi:hypothetical protein
VHASGTFHFLDPQSAEPVEVPPGASVLTLARGRVCLRRVRRAALRWPAPGTALIEATAGPDGAPAGLALVPGPGCRLRLNAQPAPCLAWMRPGDELWLDAIALRLVLRHAPYVGAPEERMQGRPCGMCQLPFTATTRVWACPVPGCGVVLHLEGPETPAETRLECARLGDCPGCGTAVTTEPTWIGGTPARRQEEQA